MANSHPASKALQRSAADWNRPTDAAGLQVLGQQFMPQIEAAMPSFLKDSGPRQRAKLEPIASAWIDLPAGSFAESGTGVNTAIVVIDGPGD